MWRSADILNWYVRLQFLKLIYRDGVILKHHNFNCFNSRIGAMMIPESNRRNSKRRRAALFIRYLTRRTIYTLHITLGDCVRWCSSGHSQLDSHITSIMEEIRARLTDIAHPAILIRKQLRGGSRKCRGHGQNIYAGNILLLVLCMWLYTLVCQRESPVCMEGWGSRVW